MFIFAKFHLLALSHTSWGVGSEQEMCAVMEESRIKMEWGGAVTVQFYEIITEEIVQ